MLYKKSDNRFKLGVTLLMDVSRRKKSRDLLLHSDHDPVRTDASI